MKTNSTNIILTELSIVTNIGLDHTHLLGNTIEKIAFEKAGIIKKNIPVVIGETDAKTKKVFITKAKSENSKIVFADQKIKVVPLSNNNEFLKLQIFNEENCFSSTGIKRFVKFFMIQSFMYSVLYDFRLILLKQL